MFDSWEIGSLSASQKFSLFFFFIGFLVSAMRLRHSFLSSLTVLASTAFAAAAPACAEEVVQSQIRNVRVSLEVARTVEQQRHGLMYRKSLPVNHGMVFVLPEPRPIALWMKNTLIDLDAAFLDEAGCIFQISQMTKNTLDLHRSITPTAYAIEISRGWFAANGITTGTCFKNLPQARVEQHLAQ